MCCRVLDYYYPVFFTLIILKNIFKKPYYRPMDAENAFALLTSGNT